MTGAVSEAGHQLVGRQFDPDTDLECVMVFLSRFYRIDVHVTG